MRSQNLILLSELFVLSNEFLVEFVHYMEFLSKGVIFNSELTDTDLIFLIYFKSKLYVQHSRVILLINCIVYFCCKFVGGA